MARATARPLQRSLPRDAYVAPEFYAREQHRIFWSDWFCVGRAGDVAAAGDYRVLDVAGESVILLRDAGNRLRAHLNLCRHRGSRLLCGSGNARGAIRCPYHGWSYRLDGTLLAAPFVEIGDVPAQSTRLHEVAVDEWGGFAFVHLTPGEAREPGKTLADRLGRIPSRLARYPLADLKTARTIVYDVAANWKAILENYNECYHCAGVHPELCRIVPAFKHRGGGELDWDRGIPHRDGAYTFTASGTTARAPFPGLNDDERTRHNGELLYPNLMLSLAADHVAAFTLWPNGPASTRIVCDFLFHLDEMRKAEFDPSDAVDFWDVVNRQDWNVCEGVQLGMNSRAFEFGYYAPMEDLSLDIRRYIAERLE